MTTEAATTGTEMMHHLSEAQIDDALIGDLVAEAVGHLAECAVCQQLLAEARMPLESFKAVTLAWSERRSATMPVSLRERMQQEAAGLRRRVWGSAVTAMLALAIAVPYGVRRSDPKASPVETARMRTDQVVGATGIVSGQMPHGEADAEQIARDNQMLNEIDRELDSNAASSAAMELQDVQGQASRPATGQAVED